MKNAGPSSDDDARADVHARTNENIRGQPNVIPDFNCRPKQRKIRFGKIMRARAKMSQLTDSHALSDRDGTEAIQDNTVPDDGLGADGQVPWNFDFHGGADARSGIDSGAE